jgi:cation diffusion facilitator family transporter
VYAALIGDVLVAISKIGAAIWTGSAAMTSEAIHSIVDTTNEILLLYGIHRSRKKADTEHPFGYGRELYFWSFVVSLLIFAFGAGFSIYEGAYRILYPAPIQSPIVSYVVLALAFLFEGGSWLYSLRQFRWAKGDLGFFKAFRLKRSARIHDAIRRLSRSCRHPYRGRGDLRGQTRWVVRSLTVLVRSPLV